MSLQGKTPLPAPTNSTRSNSIVSEALYSPTNSVGAKYTDSMQDSLFEVAQWSQKLLEWVKQGYEGNLEAQRPQRKRQRVTQLVQLLKKEAGIFKAIMRRGRGSQNSEERNFEQEEILRRIKAFFMKLGGLANDMLSDNDLLPSRVQEKWRMLMPNLEEVVTYEIEPYEAAEDAKPEALKSWLIQAFGERTYETLVCSLLFTDDSSESAPAPFRIYKAVRGVVSSLLVEGEPKQKNLSFGKSFGNRIRTSRPGTAATKTLSSKMKCSWKTQDVESLEGTTISLARLR